MIGGREFKIGFLGSAANDMAEWAARQAKGAKSICVPFSGSCKVIAAMSQPETLIESWDTMIVSRAIIEGVFVPKRIKTLMQKPHYKKGYMYETRDIKSIDGPSAGLIDYIGAHGTLADKVAIASAAARCTSMGRFDFWSPNASATTLWEKFVKNRTYLAGFAGLPGTFVHHEANVYEERPAESYDLLQIDPPKVVGTSDVYSVYYQGINKALGGKCNLPKWTWRDVIGHLRNILDVDAKRVLLMYTSDVRPSVEDVRRLLQRYGTIEEEVRFLHRTRFDYGFAVRKN